MYENPPRGDFRFLGQSTQRRRSAKEGAAETRPLCRNEDRASLRSDDSSPRVLAHRRRCSPCARQRRWREAQAQDGEARFRMRGLRPAMNAACALQVPRPFLRPARQARAQACDIRDTPTVSPLFHAGGRWRGLPGGTRNRRGRVLASATNDILSRCRCR